LKTPSALSSCSASHVGRRSARIRELHLFADNDDPGRAAVRRAVARHTGEGRRVTVHWPPDEYKDWNEFVVKESG